MWLTGLNLKIGMLLIYDYWKEVFHLTQEQLDEKPTKKADEAPE